LFLHTVLTIAPFVDNTVLLSIINKHLSHCIRLLLQSNAQLWERLLFTSGGKLEIPKCNFTIIDCYYDKFCRAMLKHNQHDNLRVTSSETNHEMEILFLPINKSYKYVGIHISLNGDLKQQIQDLQDK
jgi:hypothetical protein